LATDKAIFNVSAEASGIVKEICVGEGKEAKIGEVLAVIEPLKQDQI
jgi:pyruvate/2-oxoglutarate dehydrogenase complex dihydrolipoamide acyltransferase (E2) component